MATEILTSLEESILRITEELKTLILKTILGQISFLFSKIHFNL